MNCISVIDFINRIKNNDPILEIIQNNQIAEYNIIFNLDSTIISPYFYKIKQLINKKFYSVTLHYSDQLDFLIEMIGDNKNIQQLKIDSQIMNTLIQTKLYLLVLPLVQSLYITNTISSITNEYQIEEFRIKKLILDQYDPQFKQEYSAINQIMEFSDEIEIKTLRFKSILQMGKEMLIKHSSEINLSQKANSQFDNKLAIQCFHLINECKNIKKIIINYSYSEKTHHLQQFIQQINKEVSINVSVDSQSNLKQFQSLLKNQKNIKEVSYSVSILLNIDGFKGLKFLEGSFITSINLRVNNKSFLDHMFEELTISKTLKNQITHLTCQLNNNIQIKYLNAFLENNSTLKCLQIVFLMNDKLVRLTTETFPLINRVLSLKELSIHFKYTAEFSPQKNEIYALLATLNINKLNLLHINPVDFIQDNVITAYQKNKLLSSLFLHFVLNKKITYQSLKVIYDEIQMKNPSNVKLYVENYLNPFYDCYPNCLMNLEIEFAILHKIAFVKTIAPQMQFHPEQIYLDLYYL